MFSSKKIVVLPPGKTGVTNKFFNQSDSSGVARIRTDPDLEMRTRRALLEEARVSKLNRMEYDPEFSHFQHQSELAATTCNEDDGYDPDRTLGFSHNPGASVDPYFSYSSFHPSMELYGARNNSLRYRCQPSFTVSRNEDSNFQHQSELAATTGGEDDGYDPYRALVITHNPGALVDPYCSYSSYHSSMELDRAGSTFLTSRSPQSLAVSSNEDYISLTAGDNDDTIGFFEPPSGSRYFKLPTAGGFIYEEAREQKSENLIPYSPPSDVSGKGTRAIESRKLKGFSYADHDQRRSVFSRLSGFPLILPNEGNGDNVFSEEDDNSLTANDLIQRLFDRQSGGMFRSVFSRLSGRDRLFRKDSEVPISNFKRRSNVHNVDDNVDAEIESAGMKRRIKIARLSLENVKHIKVVPFGTQKLKADEEINRPSQTEETMSLLVAPEDNMKPVKVDSVETLRLNTDKETTQVGQDHIYRLFQTAETLSPIVLIEDNVKHVKVDHVETHRLNADEATTQVGQDDSNCLSPTAETTSLMVATEDGVVPVKVDSVDETQRLNSGDETAQIGQDLGSRSSQTEGTMSPMVATEDNVVPVKVDSVDETQRPNSGEGTTQVGQDLTNRPSQTDKTMSPTVATEDNAKSIKVDSVETQRLSAGKETTHVGQEFGSRPSKTAETTYPTVTTEDNVNPMNVDSVETQTLNKDEETTEVRQHCSNRPSQIAETTSPVIASANRDAGDHSLSSTTHDGKNEVEDFMSLELELNQ